MAQPPTSASAPSPAEPGLHRWYLVANGSRARAYVPRLGSPGYDIVREWDAPEARLTGRDAGEERPGRVFASAGVAQRSGIEPETEEQAPKGHARHAFVERLVADLTHALRGRELSGLSLLAPAPMLHRLRDAMPTDLRHALVAEHAGDFTQRPTADVFAHLDQLRTGAGAEAGGFPLAH
jgi:protein required for attachment to host cells